MPLSGRTDAWQPSSTTQHDTLVRNPRNITNELQTSSRIRRPRPNILDKPRSFTDAARYPPHSAMVDPSTRPRLSCASRATMDILVALGYTSRCGDLPPPYARRVQG